MIPHRVRKNGPTVAAYRHALQLISEKSETDIQLLAIPGVRDPYIADMAVETVEEHFNAMYIMDLQEYDVENNVVTSSAQTVSIDNTTDALRSRVLDSSFVATYFPDVSIPVREGSADEIVFVPPSVVVLGAIGNNDKESGPWAAPAGYTRGILNSGIENRVLDLSGSATTVETLYNAAINPIISTPKGLVIYGQKTLMAGELDSALERVNVRRLLIDIRRRVKVVARSFIFEQNREATLASFQTAVSPILTTIQMSGGVERYGVQIDTTTTTQADIEGNIVRGKIFLQPTRSDEFISLDFDTE